MVGFEIIVRLLKLPWDGQLLIKNTEWLEDHLLGVLYLMLNCWRGVSEMSLIL